MKWMHPLLFRDVKDGVHKEKGWSNSGEFMVISVV